MALRWNQLPEVTAFPGEPLHHVLDDEPNMPLGCYLVAIQNVDGAWHCCANEVVVGPDL